MGLNSFLYLDWDSGHLHWKTANTCKQKKSGLGASASQRREADVKSTGGAGKRQERSTGQTYRKITDTPTNQRPVNSGRAPCHHAEGHQLRWHEGGRKNKTKTNPTRTVVWLEPPPYVIVLKVPYSIHPTSPLSFCSHDWSATAELIKTKTLNYLFRFMAWLQLAANKYFSAASACGNDNTTGGRNLRFRCPLWHHRGMIVKKRCLSAHYFKKKKWSERGRDGLIKTQVIIRKHWHLHRTAL